MKRISASLLAGAMAATIFAGPLIAREKERKSLELLFRIADMNEDSKLSPSEHARMRTGDNEENRKRNFKKIDRNGDGRITLEELKRENERSRDRL